MNELNPISADSADIKEILLQIAELREMVREIRQVLREERQSVAVELMCEGCKHWTSEPAICSQDRTPTVIWFGSGPSRIMQMTCDWKVNKEKENKNESSN